jgi:uncharacterized protein YheU (UPF0270 family)
MIETREIEKEFGRKAIKARMIDLAAKLHGYEQFELDSFDPLVDLMLSALAKELEKSHIFFQENFNDLCSHITERLVPNSDIDFKPSATVINVPAERTVNINADNFKCTINKEINGSQKELSFIPLLPFQTTNAKIRIIANGNKLIEYKDLGQTELSEYAPINSSIYLGLSFDEEKELPLIMEIPIYCTWFNHPKTYEYLNILNNGEWVFNGEELPFENFLVPQNTFNEDFNFWEKSYFKEIFSEIIGQFNKSYFRVRINTQSIKKEEKKIPSEISNAIRKTPELAYVNNLQWLEIKLPALDICKDLGQTLFCQSNCIPVVNLNRKFETHRVREPYKVIRVSGDEFFVDVKKIYDHNNGQYLPKHSFVEKINNIIGYYNIARNSVLRIDKRVAVEKIIQLLDTIREERNAFSSFNPDWIIDELGKIKLNLQRIEYKLGENLDVSPNDVFITLEDDSQESTLRLEYWTCNGADSNNITRGTKAELSSEIIFDESECIILETTEGGRFATSKERKLQKLKYHLQSQERIVTRSDLHEAINYRLSPIPINRITFSNKLIPTQGLGGGYIKTIVVNIEIDQNQLSGLSLDKLKAKVQNFIDKKIISGTSYKIEITPILNET